jgi:endonuclease YncB( thermonuclease family)
MPFLATVGRPARARQTKCLGIAPRHSSGQGFREPVFCRQTVAPANVAHMTKSGASHCEIKMRSLMATLWLAVVALIQPAAPAHADILKGVAVVIDGGTIEIDGQKIRLLDIEAPETAQLCKELNGADYPCGRRSALALSDFLQQRKVTCDWSNLDREGRRLARCTVAGEDVGLWLVQQGWALPDRHCKCETYRAAADQARSQSLGLWAGVFEMP